METIISKNKHRVINDLRCEVIVRLVDIGQIVDHHCFLKRSFHNMIKKKNLQQCNNINGQVMLTNIKRTCIPYELTFNVMM